MLYDAQIKRAFVEKAKKDYKEIEEFGGFTIYGISGAQVGEFDDNISELIDLRKGLSVLSKSNLLSIVATFDSLISEIAFRAVRTKPGLYTEDRKISLKDIMEMKSFDDVVDHVAWQDVQDCMRGSHVSQVEFLEKISDTKIIEHFERWPQYVEIFERRNLVAHHDLIINRMYLLNCGQVGYDVSKFEIGQRLILDQDYLTSVVDLLIEFGILLLYSIWKKKHKRDSASAYEKLNDVAYDLIKRKNPLVASRILEFALHKQTPASDDATVKMMTVNLANCYKKLDQKEKMNKTLESVDWSSSSDKFKISMAAINDDIDLVVKLMPKVKSDDDVGKEGFRSWPVFDSMREQRKFREAFSKNFGEHISMGKEELEKASSLSQRTL